MNNIQFQYPEALWLLVTVPVFIVLFFMCQLWKRRAAKKIGDERLVKELTKSYSHPKALFKFVMVTLAFALGCVALANPRQPEGGDPTVRKGVDITFALDVSNSMLATDVQPSRLDKAKELMRQLLKQMPDNRIALVLFAGQAYVQVPLTTDYSAVQLLINTAAPSTITAQGTAINDALRKAEIAFATSEDRYKAVVLITDGETHDEEAVNVAKELSEKGVIINTVGIGSPEGTTIIDETTGLAKTDASGNPVISKLNEAVLREVAVAANGEYVQLQDVVSTSRAIVGQFATAEKKAVVDTSQLNYNTLYLWLATPMLLLLIADVFFPDRKKVKA
jgi:Ca-activated chloride channel family protein